MKLKVFVALMLVLSLLMCACGSGDSATVKKEDPKNDVTADSEKEEVEEIVPVITSELCYETENFGIDVNMISFYYFTQVYNICQQYGEYLGYMSPAQAAPDFTKSLSEQYYDTTNSVTWHDYFLENSLQTVKLILAFAEEAEAEGIDDNISELVASYMKTLKGYADTEKMELGEYITKYYGDDVTEEVVKSWLYIQYMASCYQTDLVEGLKAEVSDEELEEYKAGIEGEIDETLTRDVRHILIMPDTYGSDEAAKTKADEILSEYLAGEQTEEAFEALGKEYNEDGNNLYEGVTKGQMVAEFENWLFDEARNEGDTGIVKTQYGYHIMYYVGEGDPVWKTKAIEEIVNEAYREKAEGKLSELEERVTEYEENIALIPDVMPQDPLASVQG